MNKTYTSIVFSAIALVSLASFSSILISVPEDDEVTLSLYDSIVAMDSKWEDAYNHCKLDVMEEIISEDLEFYHDQGGLLTDKKKLNEALKNNICGKVTRELKKGSIEVSPIPGYGAVEMGMHGFRNNQEPGQAMHYSKFVHLWKRVNGKWQITRVISLH